LKGEITVNRIEVETPELNQQSWNDWVQKGKLRDRVLARRWKIIIGILLALMCMGILYAALARH
jgi:hypothetical protein